MNQEIPTSNTQKTDHQKCTHENAKNAHPSRGETLLATWPAVDAEVGERMTFLNVCVLPSGLWIIL